MKILSYILSAIFALCVIAVLFISSIEILVYYIPAYYTYEYNKYDIPRSLSMEMEDLISVTEQMTSYLKGDREQLSDITATIDGQPNVNFFNSKEVSHMIDVREIFAQVIQLRVILLVMAAAILCLLAFLKQASARIFSLMMIICSSLLIVLTAVAGFIIASDFNKYFIIFHEIFFDNNLWILNPETDRLIRLVPLGFFIDTALYIAIIFALLIIITIAVSVLIFKSSKKVKKRVFQQKG